MPISRLGSDGGYVRPADWLPLPSVTAADQKFVGLIAVWNLPSNFLAVLATGNYTVDWGDGSAPENVATGVQADHLYDYNNLSASTLSSRGYRQAIVTITPNGGTLDSVSLDRRHASQTATLGVTPWLDVACSCNPASTSGFRMGAQLCQSGFVEKCRVYNGSARTNADQMFGGCLLLQDLNLFDTGAITSGTNMFRDCRSLKNFPFFDFHSLAIGTAMFQNCASILELPLFNFSSLTNGSSMFLSMTGLLKLPAFTFPALGNATSMFSTLFSLREMPAFNLSTVTNATTIFASCPMISRSGITGLAVTHSYTNCDLSSAELDAIYTNLPVVVGQTITVTGCYGATGDTPLIATAKGWTVVG